MANAQLPIPAHQRRTFRFSAPLCRAGILGRSAALSETPLKNRARRVSAVPYFLASLRRRWQHPHHQPHARPSSRHHRAGTVAAPSPRPKVPASRHPAPHRSSGQPAWPSNEWTRQSHSARSRKPASRIRASAPPNLLQMKNAHRMLWNVLLRRSI
jgi:hypothetical protein